jgi:hypothetical protein
MADFGVKTSEEGVDVKSPAIDQLTFISTYAHPMVKIYASPQHYDYLSYTFGATVADGTYTLHTIAHGYSYTPAHLSMVGAPVGANYQFGGSTRYIQGGGPTTDIWFWCYTDATNWYAKVRVRGGLGVAIASTTWKFKYNIWAQDGD